MKDKTIIAFDSTELDNFEMCDFRWHAIHHLHLQPKTVKHYFEKGSFLHYLLELYYKSKLPNSGDSGDSTNSGNLTIEEIVEKGRIESLKYEQMTLEDVGEHIFQFREYCRYYEDENIIPLYVEEAFMFLLHEDEEIQIYITGKPDLIFKYPN